MQWESNDSNLSSELLAIVFAWEASVLLGQGTTRPAASAAQGVSELEEVVCCAVPCDEGHGER